MEAAKIIIIHPGSQNLRIGRASDLNPVNILHAVAYKRRQLERNWPYHDQMLPHIENINPMQLQVEFEKQRFAVSQILQTCVIGEYNRLRVATPPQTLALYNRTSAPDKIPPPENIDDNEPWIDTNADVLYDEQLLRLNAFDVREYDIHFPIRRGDLNIHKEKGGSLSAVLAHLERIWIYALEQRLGISMNALGQYCAVLVINDIYRRSNLREFVSLLLQRLGFRACFLLQDHVAATYGAGIGYACVVDVGDQKTSISCVEDGISHPNTRVRLSYGGGDVTQVLLMLLRKCSFPYRECNVQDSYVDAKLMTTLKERFCHLQTDVCGAHEKEFQVRKHNGQWLQFVLQVGDECILAPMALFYTELMNITGKTRNVITQIPSRIQSDPEDCFDAEYLRETSRRNGREHYMDGGGHVTMSNDGADEELIVVDAEEQNGHSLNGGSNSSHKDDSLFLTPSGQVVPLDVAIIRCIERCTNNELKRKMYGCILLIGGGIKISGFSSWLENKLSRHLPGVEVNVFTKDMDAGMVAWKGAAIMSVLDSARELYITRNEWERYGLRILREKAPFIW